MTPYELSMRIAVYMEQEKSRIEQNQMLTYLNAKLPLLKKFPDYEDVFKKKETKEQSEDDMLQEILKLNAMFGGEEINNT